MTTNEARRILFQSTLSVRRATVDVGEAFGRFEFQSTLSVRRATHFKDGGHYFLVLFQSTLSVRRATRSARSRCWCCGNFNPRSP